MTSLASPAAGNMSRGSAAALARDLCYIRAFDFSAAVAAREVHIAVGIYRAPQHVAGMGDNKTVPVINKDENAPILQLGVGAVGDLRKIVPELTQKLRDEGAGHPISRPR